MNKKEYAPVVIPTLNRYDHFRQCLESLEHCIGSEQTDVFVGIDYPPSEKYIDGWKKVCNYIKNKENNNKFKSLTVKYRDHNCGIAGSGSNAALLIRDVSPLYDNYIFTEDDNVFSPNFLLYINYGLDFFKYDKNCTAICGYNYYGVKIPVNENVYLSREFSAWGTGFWTKKNLEMPNIYHEDFFKGIMSSWCHIWKIYRNEPRLLNTILLNSDSHTVFGDTARVCYQYLYDKYSLFPTTSKVRNVGFDNTGTTIFIEDDNYNKQVIDSNTDFTMDKIDRMVLPEVQKSVSSFFKRSAFMNVVILVRVAIYKYVGIDILYFEAKRRNRTLFKK